MAKMQADQAQAQQPEQADDSGSEAQEGE